MVSATGRTLEVSEKATETEPPSTSTPPIHCTDLKHHPDQLASKVTYFNEFIVDSAVVRTTSVVIRISDNGNASARPRSLCTLQIWEASSPILSVVNVSHVDFRFCIFDRSYSVEFLIDAGAQIPVMPITNSKRSLNHSNLIRVVKFGQKIWI